MKKIFVALVGCFTAFSAFAQDDEADAGSSMEGQAAEQNTVDAQDSQSNVADASDDSSAS